MKYSVKIFTNAMYWFECKALFYKGFKEHRINGPSSIFKDGNEHWYQDGKFHRLDGPAVIGAHNNYSRNEWYIEGIEYSEDEFNEKVKKLQ